MGYDTKVIETFGNTVKSEICDNSELKTEMYLVDCDYDKGKCWESSIIGDDFYFKQLLSIGLEKEEADMDRIYSVICFFRHVAKETNAEILITSAIHNDICLLRGDIVFWDEHFHQIYKSQIDNLTII